MPRILRREVPANGPWPDEVHPVLRRVYAARGVLCGGDAEPGFARLLPPDPLGGLDAATALLADAIARDAHIVVVGDFDCDGATGAVLAVRGLRLLGARRAGYRVPHRIEHGYGLSPALVASMTSLAPDLVITVDSGIACLAGVAAAKARGWKVLITDHHLPGERLPQADAIVNPNLGGDPFPSKALAGVGTVFYLLLALRRRLREAGLLPAPEPDLSTLLDLVAIGTVADLVPLDCNNRLLVAAGLRRIRCGQCGAGVRALAEVAGRRLDALTSADIAYAIAPRINAAGRLEDMALGIECLLTDDAARAHELAALLDGINAERRELQQQMVEEAEALVAALPLHASALPAALCLFDPGWHPGIVGLVASKLKERWHRPVIAFAPGAPGGAMLRGSARSIPGFHIRDALAAVDALHPGLIERFGGHAAAAGLSLDGEHFGDFTAAFTGHATRLLDAAALGREIVSDGPLEAADFDRGLAETLRLAGPWGQGFPEPLFDGVFDVLDWRVAGERHLRLTLRCEGRATPLAAVHFGGWAGTPPSARVRAVYRLDLDDWRDRRDIQLVVRHLEPLL